MTASRKDAFQSWPGEGSSDFLHLKNRQGGLVGYIAADGTLGGSLLDNIPAGPAGPASGSLASIQYVSTSGNDSNDGLTWQTAKLTISGALVALPNGSAGQCGDGVIYFTDGVSATPTVGQGIWLMNSSDPNFSSPPTGWLKAPANSLSVIGIPTKNNGPNAHLGRASIVAGSGSDNLHPGLWISGNGAPLYFANININYPGRAYVIGVDSNNAITTSASGVVSVTFENCTGSVNGGAGLGPTWTIGGESYWIELIDCGSAGSIGTGGHVAADDTAQAFLIDGRGSSGGQIINFRGYTNLGQGGIKFYAGSNNISQVSIEDATEEGSFSASSPVAPVYWVASGGSGNLVRIGSALIADGGSTTMPAVQNDGNAQIFVTDAWGVNINTQGPMTSVADYGNNYQNLVVSPLRQNQTGFFGSWASQFHKVVGLKDDTRRQFTSFSRFANAVSQVSSNWAAFNGGSVTTGVAGPDGSANAARVSTTIDGGGITLLRTNITYAVGDWIIIGGWVRANAGTGMVAQPLQFQMLTTGFTFVGGNSTITAGSYISGDGEWQWVMAAAKVATIGTNPSDTGYWGLLHPANVADYCYPVFIQIASGTVSDNEVFEIVHSFIPNRDNAPVGSVSTQRGATFMTDGVQMPKITASVVAPGAGMGFLRWEAGTGAGTLKLVAYAGTSTTGVTVVDNVGAGN